jgi:hypothetical protein
VGTDLRLRVSNATMTASDTTNIETTPRTAPRRFINPVGDWICSFKPGSTLISCAKEYLLEVWVIGGH